MKRFALLTLILAGSASAASSSFQNSAFCQKNGCTLVTSWHRFDRKYEVYHLKRDKDTELSLYRNASGTVVGATYSTWTIDDWSAHYAQAAAFLASAFPGAAINTRLIMQLDRTTTQASANLKWKSQTLVLYRETARVPSYNQLVRMNVSAGLFQPGQP